MREGATAPDIKYWPTAFRSYLNRMCRDSLTRSTSGPPISPMMMERVLLTLTMSTENNIM